MNEKKSNVKMLCRILFLLWLTFSGLVLAPNSVVAATDTMTNKTTLVISDKSQHTSNGDNTLVNGNSRKRYPKTNEIQSFAFSFLGTLLLAILFLLCKRRREKDA